ncbi:MAG: hypothetical protein WCK27_00805 [Verrucomicrobiota bacterium]
MKPTDSSERIKALMRQHTATMAAPMPAPTPTTALRPPPVAAIATANPTARPAAVPEIPKVSWDRITIRLTAGELEKINDVVIATQQANRWGRVTTTDILRVALRRIKNQEAIDAREIKALRARDGRFARGGNV